LPVVVVAVVTILFQLLFFDRWISFMDEGHMLEYADLLAGGGELYRDATVYPLPGSFYLLAALYKVFEPSILLSRWIVTIEFSAFVTLAFVLVRRLVSPAYSVVLVVLMLLYRVWAFPHWHMYSYSTTSLLILLASAVVLVRFFDGDRPRDLMAAGLLFGLGVLFKQDYGAAALVAMSVALVVNARTGHGRAPASLTAAFVRFLAPASLVGVATGAYFAWRGLLGDLVQFTVLNHFSGMATYHYMAFPSLLPLFGQDAALRNITGISSHAPAILVTVDWQSVSDSFLFQHTTLYELAVKLFYFGPRLFLVGAIVRLIVRRHALAGGPERSNYLRELVLVAFGAALVLLISLNKPQDYVHMAVLYWPILCLSVVYAHDLLRARPRLVAPVSVMAALVAVLVIAYTGKLVWLLRSEHDTRLDLPRGGIYVTAPQAETITALVHYVDEHSRPDERVAVLPYSPLINFLADRRGPHRSAYILWPFPEIPDRDRAVVDAMERTSTNLVVFDFVYFHDFPRIRDYAPVLFEYLVDNFTMDRVFSSNEPWPKKYAVFRREPEPHEGVPLLEAASAAVDVTVEGDALPPVSVPPDERGAYVAHDSWPLRRVLAIRPSVGARTVLSVPLRVPADAVLETSIGIKPVLWDKIPPSWVRFEVAVRDGRRREVLATRSLDPTANVADRGWFDLEVSLAAYAGQDVVLELSTECQRPRAEHLFMGGWGEPRISTPAGVADKL